MSCLEFDSGCEIAKSVMLEEQKGKPAPARHIWRLPRRSRNYVTNAHVPSPLFVSLFCVLVKIENRKPKIENLGKKKVNNEPYCITNTFSRSEETSKEAKKRMFLRFRLSVVEFNPISPVPLALLPCFPPFTTCLPVHQTTHLRQLPAIQFNPFLPSFLPSFLHTSSHTKIKIKNLHSILPVYKWHSHHSFA